jgi:hypothetical protein
MKLGGCLKIARKILPPMRDIKTDEKSFAGLSKTMRR